MEEVRFYPSIRHHHEVRIENEGRMYTLQFRRFCCEALDIFPLLISQFQDSHPFTSS